MNMPRGDQTGPNGMGPMSGRGAGFCAGYETPGYAYPMDCRWGMRRAWGRRSGRPMGFGHRGFAGRGGMRGEMHYAAYAVPYPPEEKEEMLKNREIWLQEQLEEVRGELKTMSKDPDGSSTEEAAE